MKRVPLAKLETGKLSQTALVTYANKHRLAIAVVPGSTNFPDVPVSAATLATLITNYRLTLAAAYKGTKTQTAAKDSAKNVLIQALQQNYEYVNQIAQAKAEDFYDYPQAAAFVATSGFNITTNTSAHLILEPPIVRSITSDQIGQAKILLNKFSKSGKQRTVKVPGKKLYQINYRVAASGVTPVGPWLTVVSSAYFTTITDLTQGSTYEFQIYAIGRDKSLSAPTAIRSIVIL